MRFIAFFLILFSIGLQGLAQDEFLEEELGLLLFEEINRFRTENSLHALEADEILQAAAFDQANYILEKNKISHQQDRSKKESLQDRILYYEGLHANAGENAAIVAKGRKEKIEPDGERVAIDSDLKLIQAAVTSWLEEEESRLNLLDPDFYRIGTSVLINDKQEYVLVAVMASQPYQLPNQRKAKFNFQGISPYDEAVCNPFLEKHSTLPQLFSDVLQIEGNQVFFRYHSLSYIEEVIGSAGDGLAIDVIQRDQFSCESGNRLFPTEINDGYLLPQARRSLLNNFNSLKEEGKVKVKIAELPDFYQPQTTELNLIIVKSGHYCETVPHNNFESESLSWFDIPLLYVGKLDTNLLSWQDSSRLIITEDDSWKEEVDQALERFGWMNYKYEQIQIQQSRSPIHPAVEAHEFQAFFNLKDIDLSYDVDEPKVDWERYDAFKKNSFYELETRGMSRLEEKEYLREKIKADTALANFLSGLNKIEIHFTGRAQLNKNMELEKQAALYKWFFEQNKIKPTLFIQTNLMEKVDKKNFNETQFPKLDPRQKKENLPLINNQIVLTSEMGRNQFEGNSIYLAFLELYLISKAHPEINFNYHLAQLHYWSQNKNTIKDFEGWEKAFKQLSSKKEISKATFAKSMLNYHLLAVDYYFDQENFEDRKKSFEAIMKWQARAQLSSREILQLAIYLTYQDQVSKAVSLLKSKEKSGEITEDQLFYLLQIGIYNREVLSETDYLKLIEVAAEKYPKQFCNLFSKKKMGIQQLKNNRIKTVYCAKCNDL